MVQVLDELSVLAAARASGRRTRPGPARARRGRGRLPLEQGVAANDDQGAYPPCLEVLDVPDDIPACRVSRLSPVQQHAPVEHSSLSVQAGSQQPPVYFNVQQAPSETVHSPRSHPHVHVRRTLTATAAAD